MNQFLREELVNILKEHERGQQLGNDTLPTFTNNVVETWVSPMRLKQIRTILRIADRYDWHSLVTEFLDDNNVPRIHDLCDIQIDRLLAIMQRYVDIAMTGASLPDCFPAC